MSASHITYTMGLEQNIHNHVSENIEVKSDVMWSWWTPEVECKSTLSNKYSLTELNIFVFKGYII